MRLDTCLKTILYGGGCLTGKRKPNAMVGQDIVDRTQKREYASDTEISHGLIDDFFHFDRRYTEVESCVGHGFEFIDTLAAYQRCQNCNHSDSVVQIMGYWRSS